MDTIRPQADYDIPLLQYFCTCSLHTGLLQSDWILQAALYNSGREVYRLLLMSELVGPDRIQKLHHGLSFFQIF